jgi:hypothetical protein
MTAAAEGSESESESVIAVAKWRINGEMAKISNQSGVAMAC